MKKTSSTISLNNVSKEYVLGDGSVFSALSGVSLNIHEGEYSAIVGPSGSGKSTLMHIIGLLDKPTSGKIIIGDRDTAKLSDDQTSKLRNRFVGFVFQQFNLLNKLTIKENVLLPVTYAREKIDFDPEERALFLLEKFGILSKKDSYPNKISGGQQQRVAIARALIMKPQLILADEPTGNLDTKTGNEILKLFEDLNGEGITVLLVTHEPEIAARTRRQIKVLDGKIVEDKK
ncbi:MAG: Macrolide export ATP-binding/permease protein MacB [Candidatus Collierbacteria bacterium GW2011_GWF2_44_15]|uniref:Macrolide export ATP-binding/permease protein MacB n=2 Tax=Candidatus Collieribacteriota TaxID=1752725 RepID=A0A0G1JMH5_9BACT|nr:MAG: Macrolide export ATP-binding/permease protein MacB [Candidatus Collierbacteria bacterium GW2011_GWF2_44_15]KKU27626.1 MAG: Macrolide export ATP-binding/permease protein MacB [Candidatus Collierbacteria bacterium GW2011_GWE1_46_18]